MSGVKKWEGLEEALFSIYNAFFSLIPTFRINGLLKIREINFRDIHCAFCLTGRIFLRQIDIASILKITRSAESSSNYALHASAYSSRVHANFQTYPEGAIY